MFNQYIARMRGKKVARSYCKQTGWYHFVTDALYLIAAGNGWPTEGAGWHEYVNSAQHEINYLAKQDDVEPVYEER